MTSLTPWLSKTSRRVFDVSCAGSGILVLAPALLILALVILWSDGPPILFSQARVGKNGKPFRIWKFRTMRHGSKGRIVTAAADERITRLGLVLRRSKLDEVPQLFNVLKGNMSLVGPRPEVPECVDLAAPIWQAILQSRPGITDPASVLYRREEAMLGAADDPLQFYRKVVLPEKLILNLRYLLNRTFWRDLKLIFITMSCGLLPESVVSASLEGLLSPRR